MIVSHQHRFIFVKTHKTASTSIEVLLARIAGDDAVVTPISWPAIPGYVPRNYERLDNPLRALGFHISRRSFDSAAHPAYYNHMTAASIRKRIGRRRWASYFTFCFERNPWEKVISAYYWDTANGSIRRTFRDYALYGHLPSDFDRYSFDGRSIGVDFVGRYERLEDDLRVALTRAGVSAPIELGREKAAFRPREATVDALFDDEMSHRVATVFRREIASFGYSVPTGLSG